MPSYTDAGARHACPDCLAETRLVQLDDNVWVLQVFHDHGCPNLTEACS